MNERIKAGFTYTVEVIRHNGEVVEREEIKNLMPMEGIHHVLNTTFKAATPVATWYIGVYEGNYTPTSSDVMATFPALATESTTYTPGTRPVFTAGTVAAGTLDNAASKAEFTFTADKTIYGGFISSASGKGSTSGPLLSVVKFGSPKSLEAGSTLRVTAGFTMASA